MKMNITKFQKFVKTVVNPATVVSLIESLDSALIEEVQLPPQKEPVAFRAKRSGSANCKRSKSIQSLQIPTKISKSNARNAVSTLPRVQ
jgi:pyrrolidone-carboxylate peptidase